MNKIRNIDYEVLFELIKDCRRSDRELAKVLGCSQPTITRSRTKIQKEGMILDYAAIPDLEKLDIEIIAFSFFSVKPESRKPKDTRSNLFEEWKEMSDELFKKHPNIIFASTGRGLEKNAIWVSVHKDYSCYVDFLRDIEVQWGKYLEKTDSFTVSVKSDRIRRFLTIRYLPEYLKGKMHTVNLK
jgi:DNA-binding Lrp family transcriptional regulator